MRKLSFYHLLDANQIQKSDLDCLIKLAQKYRKQGHKKTSRSGKYRSLVLATLFFEPSTRTRFSFESAICRLGGRLIKMEQGSVSSSIKKGESLSDTGRVMSCYADIIAVRHPKAGSVAEFAKYAHVPVINAGDGSNQHPTQSLVDIYTIFCEKNRLDNLKIGIVGDLKYGRTVHSFMNLMSRCYDNNSFTLISSKELRLDDKKKEYFASFGSKISETDNLKEAIKDLDILYVTRTQQERFDSEEEFERNNNLYQINKEIVNQGKKDLVIMHPLPRITEISEEVDQMPQAKYFAQSNYGVYIRMATLAMMTRNHQ